VISLSCLFCSHFGRETAESGKEEVARNPLSTVKYFQSPWRAAIFAQHLKRQHSKTWSKHQRYRESNKTPDSEGTTLEFFEVGSCVPFASTIKSHLDIGGKLNFCIDEKIVTNIIDELLFDPATTDERIDAAMSIFKQNEGDEGENQAGAFQVTIGKTMAFELITSYVAAGLSFRQACKVMQETHQRTGISKLSGVRERDVAKYIRAIAAINLQKMSSLLQSNECLAFSIAFDGTTKHGISFIGVRLRLHAEGEIQNFNLLAIPFYERHAGSDMADLWSRVLSTLCPRDWTKN
jgi:hypothetical protein